MPEPVKMAFERQVVILPLANHSADEAGAQYDQAGDALEAHCRLDRRGRHRRTL
jgi:hypothetical protein